jgi:hypothetical protein
LKRSQSVLDALADAETLRRVAATMPHVGDQLSWELVEAGNNGASCKSPDTAYLNTRFIAAAAAFRAVPALKRPDAPSCLCATLSPSGLLRHDRADCARAAFRAVPALRAAQQEEA